MHLKVGSLFFEPCYLMQGGTHIIGKKNIALWICGLFTALYSAVLTISSCQLAGRKDIHVSYFYIYKYNY